MTRAENYVVLEFLSRSSNEARRPMYTTGGSERSGMGFTIMESFTDRLTVRSVPGKGTTVQMRKRIAPRLAGR